MKRSLPSCVRIVAVILSLLTGFFCVSVSADESADRKLRQIDEKRRMVLQRIEQFPRNKRLVQPLHCGNLSELYKDLFMLDYDDPRKPLGAALAMNGAPNEQLIEIIFETVVRRKPKRDELEFCQLHLAKKSNNRKDAIIDIVWALCNSKEFIKLVDK